MNCALFLLTVAGVVEHYCSEQIPTNEDVPPVENPTPDDRVNEFMVAVEWRRQPNVEELAKCSGALVSKKLVVSVCRDCLRDEDRVYKPKDLYVYSAKFTNWMMARLMMSVRRVFRHPECYTIKDQYRPENDIGLLQLYDNVELEPEDLPFIPGASYELDTEQRLQLSNFRYLNLIGTDRQEVTWTVWTRITRSWICRNYLQIIPYCRQNLCASYYHFGEESCYHDSGSGLLSVSDSFVLVGLLTHKVLCGAPHSMANFVNIQVHTPWITAVAQRINESVFVAN